MYRNNFPKNRPIPNRGFPNNRRASSYPYMRTQQDQVKLSLPEKINNGVGGLSKVLTNVQQVLKVVDSATPIVKEYGPLVKNIPNMYRLLKAFKSIENQPEIEEKTYPNHEETILPQNMVKSETESTHHSSPKLYI